MYTYKVAKSKTKPHGFVISVACSNQNICALCCLKAYLRARSLIGKLKPADYLFVDDKGAPVSKYQLNSYLKCIVTQAGWDPSHYSAHSLRTGVLTSAASAGLKDWELKKLGGWSSDVYIALH